MAPAKWTRQIWIRFVEYSSAKASDPSDVPRINGVCVSLPSILQGSPGPPFVEIGIRKSRPPGNPKGPRNYPLAR